MKIKRILLMLGLMTLLSSFLIGAGIPVSASTIDSCVHEYESITHSATCTAQGYTEYECKNCGDIYKDNFIEPNGHTYTDVVVEPTCSAQGFTAHYCKVCGYQYSDNYTEPKGHRYTETLFEPTCEEYGYTMHTCIDCKGSYKDNVVERLGHDYVEEVTEVSCLENGYTTYNCARCGYSYIGGEEQATGHNYLGNRTAVTCTAYGFTEFICVTCGDRYVGDYIVPNGHEYEKEVVPATDTQLGYTKYTCKACSYIYLSDFSQSKDDGYIEKPEIEQPPIHEHSFTASVNVNRIDKIINLSVVCDCGERGENLSSVIFYDSNGGETLMPIVDGIVDYSVIPSGEYDVTVTDDKGNIMKVFTITENGNIEEPSEPTNPDETHEHKYIYYSDYDEREKKLTALYVCGCGESNRNITVTFTSDNGQVVNYTPNDVGEVDFSDLTNGEYVVEVLDGDGNVLKMLNISITDKEAVNPEEPSETIKPDEPTEPSDNTDKEGSNALGLVLGLIIFLLVVAGGIVTFVILKNKNNKGKGENK